MGQGDQDAPGSLEETAQDRRQLRVHGLGSAIMIREGCSASGYARTKHPPHVGPP